MSRRLVFKSTAILTALAVGGTSMAPAAARAQSPKRTPIVGLIGTTATGPGSARILEALTQGLRESGWVEGQTVRFELRYSEGRAERFPELAADLIRLKVDVIVASSSQATKAAKEATASIPIVFVGTADPVGAGFVASLARPGGNVTGVTNQFSDLAGKNLQLAREVVPHLRHVGIM